MTCDHEVAVAHVKCPLVYIGRLAVGRFSQLGATGGRPASHLLLRRKIGVRVKNPIRELQRAAAAWGLRSSRLTLAG